MLLDRIAAFFTKIFGSRNERLVKRYLDRAAAVSELEPQFRAFTDDQFAARTADLRQRVAKGATLDSVLSEAFANLREAMDRYVGIRNVFRTPDAYDLTQMDPGQRVIYDQTMARLANGDDLQGILLPPDFYEEVRRLFPESSPGSPRARIFDVQVVGGSVLHDHAIAEMATGEGKTLAAPLAAYLNALAGRKTHIITVNDYLVKRDRDWMAPAYEALGLSVGAIQSLMDNEERQRQYACDITYGTNNEFGFDYLRDNMKLTVAHQVQGPLNYAVIDEVDSVLIDEARTPLIISGPAQDDTARYSAADAVARKLIQLNKEYDRIDGQVNSAKRAIREADGEIAQARKDGDEKQATDYEQRREEAEKKLAQVEPTLERTTRFYEVELDKKSAHLTHEGIQAAQDEAGVGSFYVGQNVEWPHLLEQALRAHVVYQRDKDYVVQNGEVIIVDEFTGRLMIGRQWSDGLHQAVEAKERVRVKEETQTLATITIQNFFKLYGKLAGMTGTAMTEAEEFTKIYKLDVVAIPTNRPCVRVDNDDRIYRTAEEKWFAIVDEIHEHAQAGQPVLVGTTSIEKSEQLSKLLTRRYGVDHEVLNARQHAREADIVAKAGEQHVETRGKNSRKVGNVTIATNMAGRGTDIKLGPGVTKVGGLHVVGTERHEARRIDNQLRGRGGRQGDPGSSRFFLSLQDELLAVFAGEWTLKVLGWLGLKEGQHIEDRRISKGIARAQKKVEEKNFLVRKRLLEYDEVMDTQRKIFYQQRQALLENRGVDDLVWEMIDAAIEDAIEQYLHPDYVGRCIAEWARTTFGANCDPHDLSDQDLEELSRLISARAKDEAAENISVTIGEYTEAEDSREWDLRGLGSWAMSQFGVNLPHTQLRKMERSEVEEHLVQAAWKRVDEFDFSPLLTFLAPDYARRQLLAWVDGKFGLKIELERIKMPDADQVGQVIREEIRALYRRREIEYPVHYALQASFGQSDTNDPYGADHLARWANHKYRLDWKLQTVQGRREEDLRRDLVAAAERYMTDGRIAAEVKEAMARTGGEPEALAEWARQRFDTELAPADLADAPADRLAQVARAFMRRELTELERYLLIDIFDAIWKDHLYAMDHLKDSIGLRGFAEKDPLIEYKHEGYRMFEEMLMNVRDRVTDVVFKVQLSAPARSRYNISQTSHAAFGDGGYGVTASDAQAQDLAAAEQAGREGKVKQIVRDEPKVGANDPCPCGSGKKYKKCHGKR
ncbi:MAG: Protein translocase subunit SecA [Phycisphaerae bacterium]|nr:Protein translocase subunit SecA [Phycisphaerae bacterium]